MPERRAGVDIVEDVEIRQYAWVRIRGAKSGHTNPVRARGDAISVVWILAPCVRIFIHFLVKEFSWGVLAIRPSPPALPAPISSRH
jgi:hypothetical protein